jgi:thiosulfate dehydrogenase [quinone] large subunit
MGYLREAWQRELPGFSIGVFRILLGLMWLDLALQKAPWVIQDGHPFGWLHGWIWKEINHPTFGLYKAFLQSVVLPNFTLFGLMSFLTEIVIGLSLLLGLFTVLGGIGGALWQLNIAIGSFSVPGEWYWIWVLLIVPHLVFAHTRSGRILGLDQLFLQKACEGPATQAAVTRLLLRVA